MVLLILLLISTSSSLSYFSYSGGQPGSSPRFVHFTRQLSINNLRFQPLYGSLQVKMTITLYHGESRMPMPGDRRRHVPAPLLSSIRLVHFPSYLGAGRLPQGSCRQTSRGDLLPQGAERKVVAGCSSTSQCASTALVSLGPGDVVGLNTLCVSKLMLLPRCVLRSRAGGLD